MEERAKIGYDFTLATGGWTDEHTLGRAAGLPNGGLIMSVYSLSLWKKNAEGLAILWLSNPTEVANKKIRSKKEEEKMHRKVWGDATAFYFCTVKHVLVLG